MKGTKSLAIVMILATIVGCSNNAETSGGSQPTQETIVQETIKPSPSPTATPDETPEPYTKAVEQINKGDIDTALTYLDLTIKDFPNSQYVFNANILRAFIYSSHYRGLSLVTDVYVNGAEKYRESPFSDKEGLAESQTNLKTLIAELDKTEALLLESASHVLKNYNAEKNYLLTETSISPPEADTLGEDLTFFEEVGYPLPTESEFDEAIKNYKQGILNNFSIKIFDGKNVKFLELMYHLAIAIYPAEEALPYLNEVVKLTEDDKYNELRVDSLKAIEGIDEVNSTTE